MLGTGQAVAFCFSLGLRLRWQCDGTGGTAVTSHPALAVLGSAPNHTALQQADCKLEGTQRLQKQRVRSLTCRATGLQEHVLEREGTKSCWKRAEICRNGFFPSSKSTKSQLFQEKKKSEIINYCTPHSEKKACTIPEGILIPPDTHNRN